MARSRYAQALRDPRWQRRRLEILHRDQWRCRKCGAADRELHVHHTVYVAGAAPWEAPKRTLETLCVVCHRATHAAQRRKTTRGQRRATPTRKVTAKGQRRVRGT